MTNAAATEMRNTGIEVVGNMSWGTHFCLFYDTKADLLETLVSYCKAGLESHEFCLWVVAPPVTVEDARQALKRAVPDFDQYSVDSSIEIVPARDWYLHEGSFDLMRVITGWNQKLMRASAKGYAGVRVTGDTTWLEKKDWKDFAEYEESLNEAIANQRLAVLCTYPLAACGAAEVLDVVRTHQFAVTRRRGGWDVIETAGHKQAKAEIKRLNEDLEQRVIERTSQLTAVNVELTREILERQLAEQRLRKSEAYLAEAQRLSHTGSWARTAAGEVRYWSEECYRILGFDPHSGQPQLETFFECIHLDDQARARETAAKAVREKVEYEVDYRIVRPSGEIRNIRVIGHPVLSPSGDLVEFIGTIIDVTEHRRSEEERERLRQVQTDLAHVNRVNMMGELTASLAHELNQPIAAAITNADSCLRWLAADVPNFDRARAAATRIVKDGTRAADIISRIRLLFEKGTSQRQLADLNEIIREMIVLLHGEVTQYSISVRTELVTDLPQVMGDRVQLQQVMMNLMKNSIDAMKAVDGSRELVIKSQRGENGQLLLSVSDTGVGLPPQRADQIFNAFFTTKPHGTGMGLRICRSIVESHGGRLWAADNPLHGATFYLTLPSKLGARE